MVQKTLLVCGILSSLLYVAMNIFIPMGFPGYNSASQTVSELSATGAPTRPAWVLLAAGYTLLILAFGLGVLRAAGKKRLPRLIGIFILIYGFTGFLWPFAPMHLRESIAAKEGTFSDTMHIVFSAVTVLLILLTIISGAAAFGKWFRYYSIVTIIIFIVFGTFTGMDSPRLAANLPTPRIGIWERINIGAFLLWVVVLAVILLQKEKKSVPVAHSVPA